MTRTTIDFSMRAVVPPDVLLQEVQGESVLLNLTSGNYFGLNEVGTRMWKACTSSASLREAAEVLLGEYDVERERLCRDIQNLIEQLVEHGLLAVGP
jgi:hypothetical protein